MDKPVKLTIPSQTTAVRNVQDGILLEMERNAFDHHSLFAVKLGVEEGLMNAIKHGNQLDAGKHVHVEYLVTSTQVEVSIEDEGPGFNRKEVPDPTLEENIEKCSGRGILLIEAYMDSVRWSRNGRRVRMVKKNERDKGE